MRSRPFPSGTAVAFNKVPRERRWHLTRSHGNGGGPGGNDGSLGRARRNGVGGPGGNGAGQGGGGREGRRESACVVATGSGSPWRKEGLLYDCHSLRGSRSRNPWPPHDPRNPARFFLTLPRLRGPAIAPLLLLPLHMVRAQHSCFCWLLYTKSLWPLCGAHCALRREE